MSSYTPRSSSASTSATTSTTATTIATTWQTRLSTTCQNLGWRNPKYEMCSDRRGGRTAWSSSVEVNGTMYQARYWYDGTWANNAKEDAAEVALQRMGYHVPGRSPHAQPRFGTVR